MRNFHSFLIAFAFVFCGIQATYGQNIQNGSFETGDITGWTLDTNFPAMTGDSPSGITQTYAVVAGGTDGTKCLQLTISGSVSIGCGTAHGPSATSSTVSGVMIGDVINVDWKANMGSDNYDVYGYIVEVATGNQTQLFYQQGASQAWITTSLTSPYAGDVKFKFICGTQDATCGGAVGATMYIDNVRILRPTALPATSITSTGFNANWDTYPGAVGFYLDVSTSSDFSSFVPGYNNLSVSLVTTYPITGLTAGTTYYYRLRAMGASSLLSGNSNVISTAPVVAATAATSVLGTSFIANWNVVSGATVYYLDIATDVGFTSMVPGYSNLSVGNVLTYSVSGLTAGLPYYYRLRAANALSTSASGNVIVIKGTTVVTWANPSDIVYGTTLSATQLNATTTIPGTWVYSPVSSSLLSVGANQNLTVTFTPTDAVSYNVLSKTVQINVTKAVLTVTAAAQTRVYGAANPTLTGAITGMVNSESVATACSGAPVYACAATATSPAGTPVAITSAVGTLASTNYSFSYVNGALTITKAPLTVTADAQTRVYGAANPTLTGTITGMVNSESVATACSGTPAYACAATATSPAGTPVAITAAVGTLTSTNYSFSYVNGALTITKAPLTVTADAQTRAYGAVNPTLTGAITGMVNSESVATACSGTPAYACAATATSPAGTPVAITAAVGSLTSTNYSFSYVNGALTITKAPLTVTADAQTRVYGTANPTLTGAITGMVNSESVATACSGTPAYACAATATSPAGTPVAITAAVGTLASTNYSFSYVNGALTITKAALTVTADAQTRVYGAANPTLTGAITGMLNSESVATACSGTPAFTCAAAGTSPVGTPVAITAAVGTLTSTNYSFSYVNGALTITKAPLTVTADAQTRAYGAANPTLTGAITGMANSESVATACSGVADYACAATATSPAGTPVAITAAVGTLTSANYSFSYVNGELTITKAPLTVTGAIAANKVYDGTTDASISGATLLGVVGSEDVTLATATSGTFASAGVATGISVTPAMTITGAAISNYSITQPTLAADITAKELTVTGANVASKEYDGTTDATISGATLTGVVGSEDVTLAGATTGALASANVGTGISVATDMSLAGAAIANYTLTQPVLTADITARPLEITADAGLSKKIGAADPVFTYTITSGSLVIGETLTGALNRATGETAGTYAIELGTLSGGTNYAITLVSASFKIDPATAVGELAASEVKVFPNPTTDKVTITSKIPVTGVKVVNIYSKVEKELKGLSSSQVEVEMNELSSGAYIFIITAGGQTSSVVVVKQ